MTNEYIVIKIEADTTLLDELREIRQDIENLLKEIKKYNSTYRLIEFKRLELE